MLCITQNFEFDKTKTPKFFSKLITFLGKNFPKKNGIISTIPQKREELKNEGDLKNDEE